MNWFFVCVILTAIIVASRIYLVSHFQGFTFRYWGDFLFITFLVGLALWYGLTLKEFVILASVLLVLRYTLQQIAPHRYKDMNHPPNDIVITFERHTGGPDPYDLTQLGGFVVLVFLALYYKHRVLEIIRR
jgi:hypothetical protein